MSTAKGFTLIELLIVLVLIAVITGMAMLSMGTADPRDKQKFEAERLLKLLELSSQDAMVRGEVTGIEFYKQGYRFVGLKNHKWHVQDSDLLFKPREMPFLMTWTLSKNNMRIELPITPSFTPTPQIIIDPAGGMDLFELSIQMQETNTTFRVSNTSDSGLIIKTEDQS